VGWAVSVAELNGDRVIAAVALPTTFDELSALQGLLAIAYSTAFPSMIAPRALSWAGSPST
jgi:hypothetical protein